MLKDVRYSVRSLRQNPGFALTAIISIALAIGANSAIFSLQDGLLLRPLPIERPSEVVTITARPETGGVDAFAYPDFVELRDKNRSFEGLAGYRIIATGFAKDKETQPQFEVGFLVSGNFFDLLGVRPALGRGFRPDEDDVPGRDSVVVLSHDFWSDEFGSDPYIIGRHIRLGPAGGLDFTVIGVAPESFTGMDLFIRPAYFIPAMMGPAVVGNRELLTARGSASVDGGFDVKGRLKQGVSIESANADVAAIAKGLEASFPDSNRGLGAAVKTEIQTRLEFSPTLGGIVAAVSGIMIVVLLVASANVANLMLSRGRARAREIGIRLAIGASRMRLVRQLMTESLVVALSGGTLGLLIAGSSARFFQTMEVPGDAPIKLAFQLDERVLIFTLAVSIASAVLFGLLPAFQSTKTDVTVTLKAGEFIHPRKRFFGRHSLVTVQIGGALLLLMVAGQMYRSVNRVVSENPGFLRENRLTVRLDPSIAGYTTPQTDQFYRTLLERARGLAGIKSAALSAGLPMTTDAFVWATVPEGYQFPPGQKALAVRGDLVDENYFATMGVPIIAGRAFQSSDQLNSQRIAIVNAEYAKRAFAGNAIGKRIRLENQKGVWAEVVGITSTGKYIGVTEPPSPHLYLPVHQYPTSRLTLILETAGIPAAMAGPVREIVRSMDANMPVFSVRTMEDIFEHGAVSQVQVFVVIFAAASIMGFVLALVGLYAVVSFQVMRRTREIGIRVALGATRSQVLQLILKQAGTMTGIGIAIGILLSVVTRPALMASMGRPPSSFDPLMITLIPLCLLLSALLAAAAPAFRALRIDPQKALRQE
jgi:predicted permease